MLVSQTTDYKFKYITFIIFHTYYINYLCITYTRAILPLYTDICLNQFLYGSIQKYNYENKRECM